MSEQTINTNAVSQSIYKAAEQYSNLKGRTYIYFITDGEYVKIGKTDNVKNRLATLQTANARKLEVLFTICSNPLLEECLHRMFSDYRMNGEWFDIKGILDIDSIRKVFGQKYISLYDNNIQSSIMNETFLDSIEDIFYDIKNYGDYTAFDFKKYLNKFNKTELFGRKLQTDDINLNKTEKCFIDNIAKCTTIRKECILLYYELLRNVRYSCVPGTYTIVELLSNGMEFLEDDFESTFSRYPTYCKNGLTFFVIDIEKYNDCKTDYSKIKYIISEWYTSEWMKIIEKYKNIFECYKESIITKELKANPDKYRVC